AVRVEGAAVEGQRAQDARDAAAVRAGVVEHLAVGQREVRERRDARRRGVRSDGGDAAARIGGADLRGRIGQFHRAVVQDYGRAAANPDAAAERQRPDRLAVLNGDVVERDGNEALDIEHAIEAAAVDRGSVAGDGQIVGDDERAEGERVDSVRV